MRVSANDDDNDDGSGDRTLRRVFDDVTAVYTRDVVGGAGSDMTAQQTLLRRVAAQLEALWHAIEAAGVYSSNEELDDYSTTALEMLWTPYMAADVYQRIQDAPSNNNDNSSSNSNNNSSSEREAQVATRREALARSHHWFVVFFTCMQDAGLLDEQEVERYAHYHSDQRARRIELARRCRELREQWQEAERVVAYARARRARNRRLGMTASHEQRGGDGNNDDGDDDDGGEDEERVRACALARLRWSCYDACHQLQLSQREAELLQALTPEQRAHASQAYQARLDAVRAGVTSLGRQTYTILPGGAMVVGTLQQPVPVPASVVEAAGGGGGGDFVRVDDASTATTQAANTMSSSSSSSSSSSYAHEPFRQQIRRTLMTERNAPTMTLQAFADKEMALARQQAEAEADSARQQADEDARLGPDGVEERQRQKDSAWADWRDDHPAFGPTSKGNFA